MVAHRRDRRLEVVALLAAHPELVPLHLVLDALEVELLEELPDLARLVGRDAHAQGDRLAHRSLGGLLDLPEVERLERHLAAHELLLEHLGERLAAGSRSRCASSMVFSLSSIELPVFLKSNRVLDLPLRLVDRVADLLHVELGDDVERGHVGSCAAVRPRSGSGRSRAKGRGSRPDTVRAPGRYPSGQRGQSVKLLRKLRWFESNPAHSPAVRRAFIVSRCVRPGSVPRSGNRGDTGDMPGRRLTRRSAGTVGVVPARSRLPPCSRRCGGSGYHYVKSSEDRTFFKVPDDWKLYDEDVAPRRQQADLSDDELRGAARAPRWIVGVRRRIPSPRSRTWRTRAPKYPVGQAIVQRPHARVRRRSVAEVAAQPLLRHRRRIEKENAEVLRYEPVELDGGFHGSHLVARLSRRSAATSPSNQIVLLDQATTKVYALSVSCATECYDKNESKIDTIIDSWTVEES